jgi:hypothetical protein
VETDATVSGERDGLEYRCVPLTAPSIAAGACMWRDDGSVGIVLTLDGGIDETRTRSSERTTNSLMRV